MIDHLRNIRKASRDDHGTTALDAYKAAARLVTAWRVPELPAVFDTPHPLAAPTPLL
jgi:hypothetical protein